MAPPLELRLSAFIPHAALVRRRKPQRTLTRALSFPLSSWAFLHIVPALFRMYIETHTSLSHLASSLLPIPPTSTSYLLSLYTLTLERDALLSQIDLHHEYRLHSSRRIFELERERLEDEYRRAREGVRNVLLDRVEERKRRLREERESGDVLGKSDQTASSISVPSLLCGLDPWVLVAFKSYIPMRSYLCQEEACKGHVELHGGAHAASSRSPAEESESAQEESYHLAPVVHLFARPGARTVYHLG